MTFRCSSLSQECTASKHRYDQCFNAWFEGYLKPIVASQPVEEEEAEPEVEEQEDEEPGFLEPFEDDEDELPDVVQGDSLTDASSSAIVGSSHHNTHHQHHYPSWSLRHEDRHPDLWPFSTRPAGGRLSRATKTTAVVPPTVEAVEVRQTTPNSTSDRSTDVPAPVNSTTSSKTSNREAPAALPLTLSSPAELRAEWAKAKKEEYDRNCGGLWTDYRECLQVRYAERGFVHSTSSFRMLILFSTCSAQ